MADHFNWEGYEYQHNVAALWDGYCAVAIGLEHQMNNACADVDDYDLRRDRDQLEPFEVDEIARKGFVGTSYRDYLMGRVSSLENQAHDLRIAYSLMLYHQWERSARSWVKQEHGGYEKLKQRVKAIGIAVEDELHELHVLVNVIKHNSQKWGSMLAAVRPDLFADADIDLLEKQLDWFSGVEIPHHALVRFFDVVKLSGPDQHTDAWSDEGE